VQPGLTCRVGQSWTKVELPDPVEGAALHPGHHHHHHIGARPGAGTQSLNEADFAIN